MKFALDGWYLTRGMLGSLETVLIAPRKNPPSALVTLCHGFGAPGTDLVPLAEEIVAQLPDSTTPPAFLFPEAPISLSDEFGGDARAWWRLNMAKLMELTESDSFDEIRNEIPDGIDEARNQLQQTIQECMAKNEWPSIPLIIGGFSQGAMLSVDTVFRSSLENIQGLIIWSGALICEDAWKESFQTNPISPLVAQSHGTVDPILPISTGRALNGFLKGLGFQFSMHEFYGPHTIPPEGIEAAAEMIVAISEK